MNAHIPLAEPHRSDGGACSVVGVVGSVSTDDSSSAECCAGCSSVCAAEVVTGESVGVDGRRRALRSAERHERAGAGGERGHGGHAGEDHPTATPGWADVRRPSGRRHGGGLRFRRRRGSAASRSRAGFAATAGVGRGALGPHDARRTEGDGVLGMGVDGDGPTKLASDGLGHERHTRGTADEQDRVDVVGADRRRTATPRRNARSGSTSAGAIICSNSPRVRRTSDQHAGQGDRDDDLAVLRQPLLRRHALLAQTARRAGHLRVIAIDRLQRLGD